MAPSPFEDEHTPLFTVGQVADMLAIKQAFLRRVDELRVVSPRRSAGGQRRYTRYEIRVIQQVVSMADEGITLQAIRRIIDLEQQLAEVTRQRDELARLLAERPLPGPRSSRSGLGQLLQRQATIKPDGPQLRANSPVSHQPPPSRPAAWQASGRRT